jgi:hypothetical protein
VNLEIDLGLRLARTVEDRTTWPSLDQLDGMTHTTVDLRQRDRAQARETLTNKMREGKDPKVRILRVAEVILEEDGYAAITLRTWE